MANVSKHEGLALALLKMALLIVGPWLVAQVVWRTWPPTPTSFWAGWLPIVIFMACMANVRGNGGSRYLWLSAILPFGVSSALVIVLLVMGRRIVRHPTSDLLLAFTVIAVAFLILILVWIVMFPFRKGTTSWNKQQRTVWTAACFVVATAVSCYMIAQATEIFRDLNGAANAAILLLFQLWIIKGSILVYYFFVFRAFGPQVVSELLAALHGTDEKEVSAP